MERATFMERVSIKDALAGKTFGQKVEYLWTYYKWVLLVIVLVFCVISTVYTSLKKSNIETIYSGTLINVDISDEGLQFLTDDFFAYLGGEEGKEMVDLTSTYFKNNVMSDPEMDSIAVMRMMASIVANELDYAIMNEVGYDYYRSQMMFAPLDEVLSPALLTQLAEELVYYTEVDTGATYPLAINITQWPFVQHCLLAEEDVYLTFSNDSEAMTENESFIAYLLNWKS